MLHGVRGCSTVGGPCISNWKARGNNILVRILSVALLTIKR